MKNVFLLFINFFVFTAQAEDDSKNDFSIGTDVVSSYVWRGTYQAGTSIQPSMTYNVCGFTMCAWGSVDVGGFQYKEVDLSASYSLKNVTIGICDYWVAGEMSYNYFDFSKNTIHLLDASLGYTFDRIPLSIEWNTIIVGDATYSKHIINGKMKKAFPTYIEATHNFKVKEIRLEAAVGVSPWHSSILYNRFDEGGRTNGFAVVNLSLKASKDIRITGNYTLPIFSQLIFNPAKEDTFLIFGIRF
jgi:hypothetical protein